MSGVDGNYFEDLSSCSLPDCAGPFCRAESDIPLGFDFQPYVNIESFRPAIQDRNGIRSWLGFHNMQSVTFPTGFISDSICLEH